MAVRAAMNLYSLVLHCEIATVPVKVLPRTLHDPQILKSDPVAFIFASPPCVAYARPKGGEAPSAGAK
ncbi:hypothetical protein JP75_07680 [Devosia riboflavina]|uniref:Uncharacterized protein n=1 Tax=Devosia riboflavina TaxID=46914 RepID=A0A087M3H6_9HYPH|nr:hypothetical protein JP75_07680 [Devosia riboflavina]